MIPESSSTFSTVCVERFSVARDRNRHPVRFRIELHLEHAREVVRTDGPEPDARVDGHGNTSSILRAQRAYFANGRYSLRHGQLVDGRGAFRVSRGAPA